MEKEEDGEKWKGKGKEVVEVGGERREKKKREEKEEK